MRIGLIVAGIILVIAGIWVVAGNASISDTKTDAQIGSLKIQHTEDRAIPEWIGIAGIVVGGVLVVGGFATGRKR
jgi:hypothetical protein